MNRVSFTVKGRPVPWKRQRANGKRRFPAKGQEDAKAAIVDAYEDAVKGVAFSGPCDAVNMTVMAVFSLPQRIPKGDPRHMGAPHTMTPDADNLGKLVKDALNGVAYEDDRVVSTLIVKKVWSDYDATRVVLDYHSVGRGLK